MSREVKRVPLDFDWPIGMDWIGYQWSDDPLFESSDPPKGSGWQLWQTVSEGAPVSPVFSTAEDLAGWLTTPAAVDSGALLSAPMGYEAALRFVSAGWAPSLVWTPDRGLEQGTEFVGRDAR